MPDKYPCYTVRVFCVLFIVVLVVNIVVTNIYSYVAGRGSPEMLEVCQAIEEKQNFMLHIKNVTVVIGSRVEIDCKVLNFGWFGNETIFWTGPLFAGGSFEYSMHWRPITKIIRAQPGVNVSGNYGWESFYCGSPTKLYGVESRAFAKSSTLHFGKVSTQHEGWYTCSSNLTSSGEKAHFMERSFYLSVVQENGRACDKH